MKAALKYMVILLINIHGFCGYSQNEAIDKTPEMLTVRGSVRESDTYKPISKVNIQINGGSYTNTDSNGDFRIQVKKGDELIIKHKDFETVYYTIVNDERITVKVEPVEEEKKYGTTYKRKGQSVQLHNNLIDSTDKYLKKDAKKSLQFVADALEESNSTKQNAETYELLADVYFYWKQYDLAVTNYKISLQNTETNEAKLKLAKAYEFNKNYQESIGIYSEIEKEELSNWQLTTLYEGLGDVYVKIKNFSVAIDTYDKGLQVAQKHLITPKITDLNSKIARAYDADGKTDIAQGFFSNSLNLAEKQNKKRAIEEKVTVADFQSKNQDYSEEIKLRKQVLEDLNDMKFDSLGILSNESALNIQKQNYKIGSSYFSQKDYDSAIPYLEKSIEVADDKEDLIVKKDATRKLSEVYRDAGDFENALKTYQAYTETVDKLYAKKEQEISQITRFNRDISTKQNRITSLETDRELSQSKYQLTTEQSKRQQLIIYSLILGLILLLVTAYFMYKFIKQQKLANNLLALKSLRSQMNPHFIFNALNSVNSFIALNDERTANKYLSDFSHLMRAVLENSEEDFIPLSKEIELLQHYTKLEHFRFQDKFDYIITVDESININEFQIPPMLLQPYIENAVWHGLRYKTEKGHLNINIVQQNKTEITITITDDGIGRKRSKALKTENQQKQNSKGMGNIKKRVAILNEMYKDKVTVAVSDFQNTQDAGTKVIVTLKKD